MRAAPYSFPRNLNDALPPAVNPALSGKREIEMKKNGFTLLEIIIILFLITLILGLSSVFFAGFLPSTKINATGREITGIIRHARSLARMNMESRTVMIDLDNRTYGIEGMEMKHFPPEASIRMIDPLSGGEITRGKYPIVFSPAGGATGGTIILSWGKKAIRIDMNPITGAVSIKDGQR
jgi:general secretion pathway protein H